MNRILLLVAGWVGRGVALRLSTLRSPKVAEILALRERIDRLRAENEILRSRLLKIESYRRPHFQPWQRLAILWHRTRYGMSLEATAQAFVISRQAILNWMKDIHSKVPRLVQARVPMNSVPDLVREITHHLRRQWPRWGTRRMAGVLARLGLKASRTSLQRILRQPPPKKPRRVGGARPRHPLQATRAGHVYVLDFTQISGFFRSIAVGAVIDVFTRQVLAIRIWSKEPSAASTTRLLQRAFDAGGRPTWVISDRGRQFRSRRFRNFLGRAGIQKRYAALGDADLSKIDRFWRTMKEECGRGFLLFKPVRRLQRELGSYTLWYNTERPHYGLNHRSPGDAERGSPLPDRKFTSGKLEVRYMSGNRHLPVFRLRDAS